MGKIKVNCPAKTTLALGEEAEPLEIRRPELVSGSRRIKVNCPAKINLTLEILNKREDGFHNIQSVMQTINLFDVLTIDIEESEQFEIKLSGTSEEIPYDAKNLVYKAAELFFENTPHPNPRLSYPSPQPSPARGEGEYQCWNTDAQVARENATTQSKYAINIHIEKNIPIAAGLAGGSTDAAGTIWGLNELLNQPLTREQMHEICAKLGSDLNFCLEGGCQLTTGRGEILEKLPCAEFNVSLIKPKSLGISAKEAYVKFSELENKPNLNMTKKLIEELNSKQSVEKYLHNDLEIAIVRDYSILREIQMKSPESIMSGSGSTFFGVNVDFKDFDERFWIKNGLKSIPHGVCENIL